ncbi:MAG: (2Fe-2S)-binding protein [Bacteriovoracaceae bacterium]|nr:(2Fe-2S)-binding protein [Bacteriovoracaceae bacterium]
MPTVSVRKLNSDGTLSTENELEKVCDKGQTLWDALDAQGFKLPHGCLSGSCTACRIEIISGSHSLEAPGFTEEAALKRYIENFKQRNGEDALSGKTIRLSCQAKISGDENIELVPFN